jgi:hypothetical protein
MPVTAKLSKKFYETLGDDVANELVEWFNQVDTTYRSEFKDMFEVHFSRFDAKLEQRVAEVRAELRAEFAAFEARIIRWMFVFWVANLGTTIALIKLLKV